MMEGFARLGPMVVVAIYVLTLVLLFALPERLVSGTEAGAPWWRRVRAWAAIVLVVQALIYAWWG